MHRRATMRRSRRWSACPADLPRRVTGPRQRRPVRRSETMDFTPPPLGAGLRDPGELGRGGMGVVYKAPAGQPEPARRAEDDPRRAATPGRPSATGSAARPRPSPAPAPEHRPDLRGRRGERAAVPRAGVRRRRQPGPAPRAARRGRRRDAAELVELLARAVHYAHQQGVVHRDLKPANILLRPHARRQTGTKTSGTRDSRTPLVRSADLRPKITDFGLAKRLDDSGDPDGTKTGAVMGTPSYMAPEQAAGQDARRRPGGGRVRARGDPLRAAHRPAAVPGRDAARHRPAGAARRAGAAQRLPADRPARPGNDLPEVPGEEPGEAVRRRRRAGRRPAAVPRRRADQGPAALGVGPRR